VTLGTLDSIYETVFEDTIPTTCIRQLTMASGNEASYEFNTVIGYVVIRKAKTGAGAAVDDCRESVARMDRQRID